MGPLISPLPLPLTLGGGVALYEGALAHRLLLVHQSSDQGDAITHHCTAAQLIGHYNANAAKLNRRQNALMLCLYHHHLDHYNHLHQTLPSI